MKALFYSEHGPADVLSLGELPDPTIGPVDVLIKVATTAINRLDIVQRHGWYTLPGFSLPHVAGMDMAGTVIELGSKVTGLSVGDRVECFMNCEWLTGTILEQWYTDDIGFKHPYHIDL